MPLFSCFIRDFFPQAIYFLLSWDSAYSKNVNESCTFDLLLASIELQAYQGFLHDLIVIVVICTPINQCLLYPEIENLMSYTLHLHYLNISTNLSLFAIIESDKVPASKRLWNKSIQSSGNWLLKLRLRKVDLLHVK